MARLSALALLVGLLCPDALAQQTALVGTWAVERLTDPNAEPASEGTIEALLPDGPTLAPVALRFGPSGDATVSLLAARTDGYERVDVPSAYRVEGNRLAISLGDVGTSWSLEQRDGGLVLTARDGSVLTLRRVSDA